MKTKPAEWTVAACIFVFGLLLLSSCYHHGRELPEVIVYMAYLAVGVILYFLPALIAKKKRNAVAILLLNLLLGWTFIGWVIALVWAFIKEESPKIQPQPQA